MDVLLIPCFRRPEFLHHCLDNLHKTGDLSTVKILFKPDSGHESDIIKVIKEWADRIPSYEIVSPTASKYSATKQSLNVLSGYKYAASISTGLVFMVEEDIIVGRDFFQYHRALHEKEPDLFCSLSTKNHNRSVPAGGTSSEYYLSHGDFCSLGTCFKREVIEQMIVPHIKEDYLAHPQAYCKTLFPASTIGSGYVEQDGLIRRIQEASGMPTAYPRQPRAYHAGFYGYNRRQHVGGTLQQKIDRLSRTIYSESEMRKAALKGYAEDSIPVPLELDPWEELQRT